MPAARPRVGLPAGAAPRTQPWALTPEVALSGDHRSRGQINYVRERRRRAPLLRSLDRRVYHSPGVNRPRVHHAVPGVVLALAVGATAIMTHGDGREARFAWPFGVAAGLTFDEVGVLIELDNPYWSGERLAFLQGAAAGVAVLLTADLYRRGAVSRRRPYRPASRTSRRPSSAGPSSCQRQPNLDPLPALGFADTGASLQLPSTLSAATGQRLPGGSPRAVSFARGRTRESAAPCPARQLPAGANRLGVRGHVKVGGFQRWSQRAGCGQRSHLADLVVEELSEGRASVC